MAVQIDCPVCGETSFVEHSAAPCPICKRTVRVDTYTVDPASVNWDLISENMFESVGSHLDRYRSARPLRTDGAPIDPDGPAGFIAGRHDSYVLEWKPGHQNTADPIPIRGFRKSGFGRYVLTYDGYDGEEWLFSVHHPIGVLELKIVAFHPGADWEAIHDRIMRALSEDPYGFVEDRNVLFRLLDDLNAKVMECSLRRDF